MTLKNLLRMSELEIQTAQNVSLQYAPASIGDRIGAFLIDLLVITFYGLIMLWLITQLLDTESTWIFIALYIPAFFYHLTSEVFMQGQSIGKKQLKIKVIKTDGNPATLGAYILRWILRPVDNFFYGGVAILIIAIGGKGQRLGDIAASTMVIKLNKKINVKTHELIKKIDDSYQPVFEEVINLSDKDIEIIRKSLDINRETANMEPVLKVEAKIKNTLKITSNLPPLKFLYTIIKDHNFMTTR